MNLAELGNNREMLIRGGLVRLYNPVRNRHGNNAVWFRRHKFGVFWVPQLAYALTAAKLRLVALDCKVCLFCAN